jgi:PAS domain S-box-containing protein
MPKSLRVLHVEDSERDAELLARHLTRAGYELVVDRVETSAQMLAALNREKWDLVLCDYSMPQFSAPAALTVLKEADMDLPFIIISGTIGEDSAVAAMRAGAHDYLMKDRLARLVPTIERELQEARSRAARRAAEAALRESEDRYRDLVEHSHDLICTHSLEGRVLSVNQAAADALGFAKGSLIGCSIRDILVPEMRDRFDDYLTTIKRDGAAHGLMKVQTRSGERRVWDYTNTLRTNGVATPLVRGVAHDITEKWLAEKTQREYGERYRQLFENNPLPMWVYDVETLAFLAVNNAAVIHYGYSEEEFLAMTIKDIRPAEDVPALYANVAGLSIDLDRAGVWRHRTHDGTLIDVEITSHLFQFSGRRAEIALAHDVTERRRAEALLHETNHQLQTALASLQSRTDELAVTTQQLWQSSRLAVMGELAASIAHELNNPLATVSLRTESLLLQAPASDSSRHALEIIAEETERMGKLVGNLLEFSRRGHQQISTLNLRQELERSLEFIDYHLRSRAIKVVLEFAAELPPVLADRQQLRQVFLNVITNASDAMPSGGTLTVRGFVVETDSETSGVALEFADTGEGIAPEALDKVWDPFFTTKPEGKGTGLGLPICRRTIEEHRGTITISSTLGQGTIITIMLPVNGRE